MNKNAHIKNRIDRTGKLRTETTRRDPGAFNAAVSTNKRNNSTKMYVDLPDGSYIELNGHEARTLYRLLDEHYNETNKQFCW